MVLHRRGVSRDADRYAFLVVPLGERARLELVRADITTLEVDAIVNAANAGLLGGGGVDGAIHRAGGPAIMEACRRIGGTPAGTAVVTEAGRLRARWVIHAVAPRFRGRTADAELLRGAYVASMQRARELGAASIAFPSLGTGAYGYPIDEAAPIALAAIASQANDMPDLARVVFALFSDSDRAAYERAAEFL